MWAVAQLYVGLPLRMLVITQMPLILQASMPCQASLWAFVALRFHMVHFLEPMLLQVPLIFQTPIIF